MSIEQVDAKATLEPIKDYSLKELIRGDIEAWFKIWKKGYEPGQPFSNKEALRLVWNKAGLRATLLYRFSHFLWRKKVTALPGVLMRLNITLHGFDIPFTVPVGPGFYVPHPVGIVITARQIGRNVSLISAITIGLRNDSQFPTIGDNVFIGAGARILGDIVVGDNAQIGANAVVIKDVPAGRTAVGVPAKII